MRRLALLATCVVLAPMSSVASANTVLVLGTPIDSIAHLSGLGAEPTIMELQPSTGNSPFARGAVTPGPNGLVEFGDIPNSFNEPLPSDLTLSNLGWTGGGQHVGLSVNFNQAGNTPVTLQSMTLAIFNGTKQFITFPLGSPITFSPADLAAAGVGSGAGVFNFTLDLSEQQSFNNLVLSQPGSAGYTVGLVASVGCDTAPSPTCQPTSGGADIFHVFDQANTDIGIIPLPATLPLFATGLGALGLLGWFRKRKSRAAVV